MGSDESDTMNHPPEPFNLLEMQAAAVRACALLKTLANPDRLLLLCQLTQAEYCVSELAAASGIQRRGQRRAAGPVPAILRTTGRQQ